MKTRDHSPAVTLIANPASAGGRTAQRIGWLREALRARFGSDVRLFVTSKRGDAQRIASHPADHPGEHVIAVLGGDGTIQEVANGLMKMPPNQRRRSVMGILSSGTGQGFAQSLGLPETLPEQADVVAGLCARYIDLGCIRAQDAHARIGDRYLVNECQAGIGGEVVRRVEASSSKRLGGRITFALGVLRVAAAFPNNVVHIDVDRTVQRTLPVLGLVVGNGSHTGGGMNLTKGAVPWDGALDLLIMKAQSFSRRVLNLSRIYSAKHLLRPEFELMRVHRLDIYATEPVPIEADGEYLGQTPATIGVVPHALRVAIGGERR